MLCAIVSRFFGSDLKGFPFSKIIVIYSSCIRILLDINDLKEKGFILAPSFKAFRPWSLSLLVRSSRWM
jgi:hypothetical protein